MNIQDDATLFENIAKEMGITLYRRFTESEASDILGISTQTLRRIKSAGKISYLRVSERHVRFFGFQLCEYLLSNIKEKSCPAMPLKNAHIKSENSGFQSNQEALRGAELGMKTAKPDVNRLALKTFQKQS